MTSRIYSATERAIKRKGPGQSVYASARDEGIAPSTLYRALKRIERDSSPGCEPHARVVIAGAGALGRELMGWLRIDGRTDEIVFLDDQARDASGCNVIGGFDDYAAHDGDQLLIAVADPAQRERIAQRIGRAAASFIAVSVTAGNCAIGAGSLLLPHCLVSADATLGACVIVNTYSSIGHDVVLGDYCTLSSHVDCCGRALRSPLGQSHSPLQ